MTWLGYAWAVMLRVVCRSLASLARIEWPLILLEAEDLHLAFSKYQETWALQDWICQEEIHHFCQQILKTSHLIVIDEK